MEDPEQARYVQFKELIWDKVSEIAANRDATVRTAQEVARRLFKSTGGDPTKLSDEEIAKAFEQIDLDL